MRIYLNHNGSAYFNKVDFKGDVKRFYFIFNGLSCKNKVIDEETFSNLNTDSVCDTVLFGKITGVPDDILYLFKAIVEQWETETTSYKVIEESAGNMSLLRKKDLSLVLSITRSNIIVNPSFCTGKTDFNTKLLKILTWYYSLNNKKDFTIFTAIKRSSVGLIAPLNIEGYFLEHNDPKLPVNRLMKKRFLGNKHIMDYLL